MFGKVIVVTGPMRCSKTLEVILAAVNSEIAKKKTLAFHPYNSSRWGDKEIVSRMGVEDDDGEERKIKFPSIPLGTLDDFFTNLPADTETVVFDDAQFFTNNIVNVVKTLRNMEIDVWISGLDMDAFLQPFGPMPYLMAIADKVIKKTAVCHYCLEPAQTTYRITGHKDQILVGDNEYIPLCWECWNIRKEHDSREAAN